MKPKPIPLFIDNWEVRKQIHTAACQLLSAKIIAGMVTNAQTAQNAVGASFQEAEMLMLLCCHEVKMERPTQ
jgi:hypothetical protein